MSLQIWLPLTKDLRQQGLDNVTVTNNGAIYSSTDGKLGGTYTFNGSSNYLTVPKGYFGANYSYSLWFYTTSTSATQNLGCCRNNVGEGFAIFLTGGKIRIDGGGTGSDTQWTTSYTFSANMWTHLTVTCANGVLKFYINGVYQGTKTITLTSSKWGTIYSVGASQTNGSGYGNFLNGKINDVRIYDYCLSPMEVKELAKGLVLHYPLNRQGWGQENILTNSSGYQGINNWSGVVSVGSENGFPFLIAKRTNTESTSRTFCTHTSIKTAVSSWSAGDKFTISGYYKIPSTETYAVGANMFIRWTYTTTASTYSDTGFTIPTSATKDEWIRFEYTYTIPASYQDGNVTFYLSAFAQGLSTIYWKNIKLEKGDIATPWCPNSADTLATVIGLDSTIEYDYSGFDNNGEKIGVLTYTSDTPKYFVSTHITDGANTRISTPILTFPNNSLTLNIWFRSTNTSPTGTYHMVIDSVANRRWYEMCINNTGFLRAGLYINGTRYVDNCTSKTALDGNWHMLTMTYDGTIIQRYFDGVMEKSTSITATTGLSSPTAIMLGRDGPNASYACIDADLSDFRIYATALSADDVKSLYQNSAYIDSSGNIYGTIHEV